MPRVQIKDLCEGCISLCEAKIEYKSVDILGKTTYNIYKDMNLLHKVH